MYVINHANAVGSQALYSGIAGYNNGSQQMSDASRNLANSNNRQAIDINKSAVDLVSGSVQAQASAEVISSADSMLGTIIDIFV